MVKHGVNKKRRAGRYGRTKLKNRNHNRWDPTLKIADKNLREHWDHSKSPAANMASLGLVSKPGSIDPSTKNNAPGESNNDTNAAPSIVELFDIPESDDLGKKKQISLSDDDQKYMAKCMKKHGDDYAKMFRDIKTNNMQYTETQLRKMGSRFLLLSAEQRKVDVPENVRHLVATGDEEQES